MYSGETGLIMKMIGVIFSNIYDASLGELTKHRTLASLPFGGRYRQIDFVLSNMVNSNISTVGVITKYNYQSLMDHLGSCSEWDLNRKNGGLFILPPFGSGQTNVYRGKIEALHGALTFLQKAKSDYVVMSDSNILCNIDYENVLKAHIKSEADITIVANHEEAKFEGECQELVIDDKDGVVTDITIETTFDKTQFCGMGMFMMKRQFLIDLIKDSVAHGFFHFERDFLQRQFLKENVKLNVYEFKHSVLRNRSVNDYFHNNLKMLDDTVRQEIFMLENPIYTKVRDEVPTFFHEKAVVNDCLIADGCRLEGTVENSVIFRNVTIGKGCIVKNSVIMQGTVIGNGANVENAIIDKDVIITENRTLIGAENAPIIIQKGEKI